jgi:hypothetical protein
MEILFAGSHNREGFCVPIGDGALMLRIDNDTFEPSGIIILPWSWWSATQAAAEMAGPTDPPRAQATPTALMDVPRRAAVGAIARTVQQAHALDQLAA